MIELTTKQYNKIKRAVKALNDARDEIQTDSDQNINWYLEDSNNLNLMCGPTHTEDIVMKPLHENVMFCFNLKNSSGGGW